MYFLNLLSLQNISLNPLTLNDGSILLLTIVLLVISGLISASEVAFFSFSPATRDALGSNGDRRDTKILKLLETPQRLLAAILIGNNLVNVSIILILTLLTNRLMDFSAAPFLGFVFQTIFITFILLLFGEILPKIYASKEGLKVARITSKAMVAMEIIFSPLINILIHSTTLVNKKFSRLNKTNISIDELSQALELTSDEHDEDTDILEGIIKFGNIQVIDIMTSRVDMIDLNIKTSFKKVIDLIIQSGYSRIPVYSESRDNIKGILYGKDLLPHLDKPENFRWQSLVRQAFYVPETKKIDDLLKEFQKNKVHLAIVVDEYGGTSGIVTLEDIIEEIVGDISDEFDDDTLLYTRIDNQTFLFEAKMQLNDFFKIDEIHEEDFVKISEDVETLAGLILEIRGEIPQKNERIVYHQYEFDIIAVDNRRIKKVKLIIHPAE